MSKGILEKFPEVEKVEFEEELILNVIDHIVSEGATRIIERHIERHVVPFVVKQALQSIDDIVEWCYLTHDRGEDITDPSWIAEEEPIPPAIDSWASCSVPVRTLVPSDKVSPERPSSSASRSHPPRRMVSTPSSQLRSHASVEGSEAPDAAPPEEEGSPTPALRAGSSHGPTTPGGTRGRVGRHAFSHSPRNQQNEAVRLAVEAERKEKEEVRARLEAEEREETARVQKLHHTMRGKQYTYDAHGQVLLIQPPNPERLPLHSINPRVSVAKAHPPKGSRRTRGVPSVPRATHKGPAKRGKAAPKEVLFKEAEPTYSTPIEAMDVAPGVTLRHGAQVKSGGQLPRAKYHIPVRTAVMSQAASALPSSQRSAPEESREPGSGGVLLSGAKPAVPSVVTVSTSSASASTASTAAGHIQIPLGNPSLATIANIDWRADARAKASARRAPPPPDTTTRAFDESILAAADWGQNPPVHAFSPPAVPKRRDPPVTTMRRRPSPHRLHDPLGPPLHLNTLPPPSRQDSTSDAPAPRRSDHVVTENSELLRQALDL
eukprot:gnl/Trimastix_PCT/2565.p1 GENE.gnl/Trimastix_PCT/2565~~gnl/Trimastix_PCT/2565.p1  ORF type:complete len:557 (-),score=84.95 gnl/Trimastix_PCT/2565:47-1690(-)